MRNKTKISTQPLISIQLYYSFYWYSRLVNDVVLPINVYLTSFNLREFARSEYQNDPLIIQTSLVPIAVLKLNKCYVSIWKLL